MASKCKEKYGKEWSSELVKATEDFFEDMPMGFVKHIGNNGYKVAYNKTALIIVKKLIPTDQLENEYFLFDIGKDAKIKFDYTFNRAYKTLQDMIDDGWVVD